ncbi:alpha/beta fold hydrolase [Algicella marina]|uniref:Alpha/beta fold hydrolase n=1 Tax=Algicella marina TaxID=2683284 RepID=A0A6P1T1Y9_9RHOB|nr:alpha/beta hydrolase [Algicella marina]QHQ35997.1 alpha/beta fold hydrolase [Algicella marina]
MFEGFQELEVDDAGQRTSVLIGGSGPPLLLLHGFPQTRAAWHRVAPLLSGSYTLIIPDLPGYGRSTCPPPDPRHIGQSKRHMAGVLCRLMDHLGHDSFHLAGHDRGGRVAYRLALDHSRRVRSLTLLDIMTTLDTWEAMDWQAALAAYHWPFLAQPAPLPERMIGADPSAYLHHLLARWQGREASLDASAIADYETSIRNPATIEAMAEDYRAGATVDVEIDRASREERAGISCPLLILRGSQYAARPFLQAWRRWAPDAREVCFDCGHFIAEEMPEETAAALRDHCASC